MDTQITRRKLLGTAGGALGLLLASKAGAAVCLKTPKQPEGPFYPVKDQKDKDNDLVNFEGATDKALGKVVLVSGIVTDQNCLPVKGALVEIWQACASGRYDHHIDPNPAPLDPNFQYWGRDISNEQGEYSFRTIIPGAYPAADDWMRQPHIHFKISARGYFELITQMYFAGDSLNATDKILQSLPKQDQEAVIAKPVMVGDVENYLFNIQIRKV